MANSIELESFLIKFKQLCRNGLNANLNMKSEAGEVSVTLNVVLGRVITEPSQPKMIICFHLAMHDLDVL